MALLRTINPNPTVGSTTTLVQMSYPSANGVFLSHIVAMCASRLPLSSFLDGPTLWSSSAPPP